MHSLSIASRTASHDALEPFCAKIVPEIHSNYPPKIPPLEKACLFRPLMLHYKHDWLKRPPPACGIETLVAAEARLVASPAEEAAARLRD